MKKLMVILCMLLVGSTLAHAADYATLVTNKGKIRLELFTEKAPISVANFKSYASKGFYNGTVFHRVIPSFMIQGGGFDANLTRKPTDAPIKNEADNGLKNDRGTVAMARTSDINSATSQFFINTVNNDFLNNGARDFGYAVFAEVVEGMEVVDAISKVKTFNKNAVFRDVPFEPVIIESVVLSN